MKDESPKFSIRKLFRRRRAPSAVRADDSPALALVDRGRFAEDSGDPGEAARLYREAICLDPGFALAHMSLGNAMHAGGDAAAAIGCHVTATTLDPMYPPAHFNLGLARLSNGELRGAEASFRKALSLRESFPEAWVALAEVLEAQGRDDEALQALREAIGLRSDYEGALENLAALLERTGRLEEACSTYRRMIELAPKSAQNRFNLGTLLQRQGRLSAAEEAYRSAIDARADFAMAMNSLATVVILQDGARSREAETLYRKALDVDPGYALAHGNLGNVLQDSGRLSESEASLRRAVELKPDFRQAHYALANALKDLGRVQEALACYGTALALDPQDRFVQDSLLMALNYPLEFSRARVSAKHFEWGRRLDARAASSRVPHSGSRDPLRRLRVGYISPDFRRHSIAYFIEPILALHDRRAFEVHCYSNVAAPDSVTERLFGLADNIRSVVSLDAANVAQMIRADGIDILVDLAGHTAGNSLEVFALQPAPVQATYLGYPNTTGLRSIGWRITDIHADPEGDGDEFHSERLIRLPQTFLCVQPPETAPQVAAPPARTNGHVTFGSFNALPKLTPAVIDTWSRLLDRIPRSKLLLKAPGLGDKGSRAHVSNEFSIRGIAPDRLTLLPMESTLHGHLARYQEVDIGLDPFPFNGTTTTLEALWMGVPVVALRGDRHAARVSASILTNAGLGELVAETANSYVECAWALAADGKRIAELRRTMRDRIARSPLCDRAVTVGALETAYRGMWDRWCAGTVQGYSPAPR